MTDLNNKKLERSHRTVPLFILCIAIFASLLIPLKVMGHGFLPQDDALRHAAKAVSGKEWSDILVLRDDVNVDSHPGWHTILGAVHKATNCDPDTLVVFSVIFLFILFFLVPILLLPRPEAWLISLLIIFVTKPSFIVRLFLGRPYIFTMSVVLVLCFLWSSLKNKKIPYNILAILSLLIASSTWIHGNWYLFVLPLICFFLAREWRVGARFCAVLIIGVAIGAALTGHPYVFLKQTLFHAFSAFGGHTLQSMLVFEFQGFDGDALVVLAVLGMLGYRQIQRSQGNKTMDNPVFILAVLGWILGFYARRFWLDWGIPATCVWIAHELQDAFDKKIDFLSWRRFLLTVTVATTLFFITTNDFDSRWTSHLPKGYLSMDIAEERSWLPEEGGIIYSDDMTIFYDTFFKNPQAPWRYMLGFEPAMMPPKDLAIYRRIQWNLGALELFEPWVKKMKPEDRLIVRHGKTISPTLLGLQWRHITRGIWIGRLPKNPI